MERDNDILVRLIVKKKPGNFVYDSMRITKTDFNQKLKTNTFEKTKKDPQEGM